MKVAAAAQQACELALARLEAGPDAFAEAMALLNEAASLGSGRAIAKQAHLLAAGVTGKPDWDRCVAMLGDAAALGDAEAAGELAVLAGRASSIDIRAFVAPRPTRIISTNPRVRTLAGFMSPMEAAWLVKRAAARLEPATVYANDTRDSRIVSDRTNRSAAFTGAHMDMVLVLLQNRIANSIGLPAAHFEPAMLLHYRPGEEFRPHVDYLDAAQPGHAADIAERGQRVATFLVSLNDDYEGGETDFPRLAYRYKGRTGDALTFANTSPDLAPDPRTLHAGLPPTRGEKWMLSQWMRSKPAAG